MKNIPCECMERVLSVSSAVDIASETLEYMLRGEKIPSHWDTAKRDPGPRFTEAANSFSYLVKNCGVSPKSLAPMSRGRDIEQSLRDFSVRCEHQYYPSIAEIDAILDGIWDNINTCEH